MRLAEKHRSLHVEEYCEGCGACVERCASGALRLEEIRDDAEEAPAYDFTSDFLADSGNAASDAENVRYRAVPDDTKCVRCGYCTKVCPVFALKVY